MKATFILLMLFWAGDRTSMVAPEFSSKEACEAALTAARKTFDYGWAATRGTYAVCVEK